MTNNFTLKELALLDRLCSTDPIFYVDHPEFHIDEGHIHRIGYRLFNQRQLVFNRKAAEVNWHTWLAARYLNDLDRLLKQSDIPLFTKEDEVLAFIRLNFAKWRVNRLQTYGQGRRLTLQQKQVILHWYHQYQYTRNTIAIANFGLVISAVNRYNKPEGWEGRGAIDVSDIISEGNQALLRLADKFNVNLGWKFSTYAFRSVLRAIYNMMRKHSNKPTVLRLDAPVHHESDMSFQDILPDRKHQDLDKGLFDFYSFHDGREILLCWNINESTIKYWHEIYSGYQERRPVSLLQSKNLLK